MANINQSENRHFIAFDLGATSGRTILGTVTPAGKLETEEITRFPNQMVNIDGRLHWNIFSLYEHLIDGMKAVARKGIRPESIGIDTWGVDVAYISPQGKIMELPYSYRDCGTRGAAERFFKEVMPAEELYGRTGIQHMDFNTVFQLHERREDFAQTHAATVAFLPDALIYLLTGKRITEYTIASTGEMLNPATREIDRQLLSAAGVDPQKFSPIVEPGTVVGTLSPSVAEITGLGPVPVVAVASHDTASAIAPIPATGADFAYLSSGTWSLMGIETTHPVINEITRKENITNEGGVFGTIRLLKNITGMWILEECLRKWKSEGRDYPYALLVEMAGKATPFKAFINPDDPAFVSPADMPEAIAAYCRSTGQPVPESDTEFVRLIFESLALKYRIVLDIFKDCADKPINTLHIIGGGSRNALLNQFTANATGITVKAGPSEASAIGNILMQTGCSSIEELREIARRNITTETFSPRDTEEWDNAYARFLSVIK